VLTIYQHHTRDVLLLEAKSLPNVKRKLLFM